MIGELLLRIRKEKHISKSELARNSNVDIGYISHIENEERTPSHKALKKICSSLDVPYQQVMYAYDKELTDEHRKYNITDHIAYDSVLAINNIDDLIICPPQFGNASIALKINDESMQPTLIKGSYAYVEFNTPLDNKDIGLFYYNGQTIIRRFVIRSNFIQLKSDNTNFDDIKIKEKENFYIIGKILGTNNDY